jgi:alanyl-tRNA synthetase
MTQLLHYWSSQIECSATVREVLARENALVLDRTVFFPQGGGQPSDIGFISGQPVSKVLFVDERVLHYLDEGTAGFTVGQSVLLEVNEDRRRLNSRYHSAAHALSAILEHQLPGIISVAGHQWPGEARVVFDGTANPETVKSILEEEFLNLVSSNLAIQAIEGEGGGRQISIEGYPPERCCGTHVSSTSELRGFIVRTVKNKSGQLRVGYGFQD